MFLNISTSNFGPVIRHIVIKIEILKSQNESLCSSLLAVTCHKPCCTDTKVKALPIVAENMFVVAVVAAVVGRCHYWLCTVVVSRRWSVWDWCGHSGGALIYSNISSAHTTTTTTPQQQLRPATTRLYNPHFPITGIYQYSLPVSST